MIGGIPLSLALLLIAIAFVGGIGIATIGPGGVFLTVALYALTDRPPGEIAGTTSVTLFLGGILGTIVYRRSGELSAASGRTVALALSLTSLAGAFLGSQLNARVSAEGFGTILAIFVIFAGLLIGYRELRGFRPLARVDPQEWRGRGFIAAVGFAVGLPSGLLGIGGPMLAVPALVVVGVPMLTAVGAAQLQSVFITGGSAVGYLLRGTVPASLVLLVSLPLLIGIALGWRLAHRISDGRLRLVLAAVLAVVGVTILR